MTRCYSMKTYKVLNHWRGIKWQSENYKQIKLINNKKKNVTAAVVAALFLTVCGGQ